MDPLLVECRTDERGDRLPERFGSGSAMLRVVEVLDRWPGEGHHYFRVEVEGGDQFILRHDEAAGTWQVQFFEAHDDPRPANGTGRRGPDPGLQREDG